MRRLALPRALDRRIREDAGHRCAYCLAHQRLVMARLEVEHIIPLAKGGTNDAGNLCLACPICNRHKSEKITGIDPITSTATPLFHPRRQVWTEHFAWADDGIRIIGLTPVGRATVLALHLSDDPVALEVRSYWVRAGWHPPPD